MRHVRIVAATAFAVVIGSSPLWVGAQSGKETGSEEGVISLFCRCGCEWRGLCVSVRS